MQLPFDVLEAFGTNTHPRDYQPEEVPFSASLTKETREVQLAVAKKELAENEDALQTIIAEAETVPVKAQHRNKDGSYRPIGRYGIPFSAGTFKHRQLVGKFLDAVAVRSVLKAKIQALEEAA